MAKKAEEELLGFVDVGGFAGIEDGKAIVKPLEVSVNKEMSGLPTKYSQRVHGERIEVYKRTFGAKANPQMSAVEKRYEEVQKPFEQVSGKMESPSRRYEEPQYEGEPKDLSPLGVLKNAFDNLDHRVNSMDSWVKLAVFLGAIGLCGFIGWLATLMR
jgi:hypothetical protein